MSRAHVGSPGRALAFSLIGVAVLLLGGHPAAQSADDLFNPNVVQRVDLLMHSQDWEKLKQNFQENTYYPADFQWNGQTVRNSGIRSRGLGSRSPTKPGIRVDFDRYSSDQTFLGLKSVILDNLTQDSSGVRESVTMQLFARLGIPASRESFARVYVNNQLIGLYAIVESVDKDLLARVFGALDGNVQNDGYLFEYNYVLGAPWRFENLGAALDPYKERFDPKTHESKSDTDKWGPIEELVRMVNDTPQSSLASVLEPRLDVGAFLRYVAAQNFVAQNDGFVGYDGMNNFYFYRLEDSTRHVFVAWDEDNAFLTADFGLTTRHDENVLMRKVMESSGWRTQYFSLIQEVAESAARVEGGQADGWLLGEMRRQLDLVADAMREDPSKPYSNDEHTAARAALLNFPGPRIAYVRCEAARALGSALPAGCS
jgi:spore coat protein CotH